MCSLNTFMNTFTTFTLTQLTHSLTTRTLKFSPDSVRQLFTCASTFAPGQGHEPETFRAAAHGNHFLPGLQERLALRYHLFLLYKFLPASCTLPHRGVQ